MTKTHRKPRRKPVPTVYIWSVCQDCHRKFRYSARAERTRCVGCQSKHGMKLEQQKTVAPDALPGEDVDSYLDRKDREAWKL